MAAVSTFITPDALLSHWQGHRRLTRRTIAAGLLRSQLSVA